MCKNKDIEEITGNFESCKLAGNAFLEVGKMINNHRFSIGDGLDIKFSSSHATNIAFACELFLKAILLKQKGKHRNTHNLKKLFKMINGSTQTDIKNIYNQYTNNHINIDQLLQIHTNSFKEWRYLYEYLNKDVDISFHITEFTHFADSLKEFCNRIV